MHRRKWLWAAVVALPLAVAGGLVYANVQARSSYICPLTGERLPCPDCCPLNQAKQQAQEQSYTCPITGEQLPCPLCCPLNGATTQPASDAGYLCPLTGEPLPCERCCPLNQNQ